MVKELKSDSECSEQNGTSTFIPERLKGIITGEGVDRMKDLSMKCYF